MEPIFDNIKFKSNYQVISDASFFKTMGEVFFKPSKNHTLEYFFYHFGLLFDSNHYTKNEYWRKNIFTPTRNIFGGKIDHILISSVLYGRDLNHDFDENEYDKYDPYFWRITRAIKFNRPDWAFYMFVGNTQGLLNGNRITEDRFITYLKLFPEEFLVKNRIEIEYIFNFFDERGYLLSLEDEKKLIKKGVGIYQELITEA